MLTSLLPALLLIAGPMDAAPTQADFSFDRSELAIPDGAASVYARVTEVAWQVCETENHNSAMAQRGTRICVADTIARAVADIDAPALTTIHAQHVSPDERSAVVLVAARD